MVRETCTSAQPPGLTYDRPMTDALPHTLKALEALPSGLVVFTNLRTLTRLCSSSDFLDGYLGTREVMEKILPPDRGHARIWSQQMMRADNRVLILRRGRAQEAVWWEVAVALAVVGHLVLIELDAGGDEDRARALIQAQLAGSDAETASMARGVLRGLIGGDGVLSPLAADAL